MKILLLNTLYAPNLHGGAERSVQQLAEELTRHGVDAVVASTGGERNQAGDARRINGVKVVYLPIANLYWPFDRDTRSPGQRKLWHLADIYNPVMKAAVTRLIEDERPDVVHTNNLQGISVSAWHAAKAARVPILHTLRDYYLTCGRCSRYRDGENCERTCWDCLPLMLARRRASALVDGVVGVSRFIRDHHDRLGFFRHARVHRVIYHFTAPTRTTDKPAAKARLRFGYLGRLTPAKGLDVMLDAFARQTRSDWELCVAGEGDEAYTTSLRARYAEMEHRGVVRFVGAVDGAEFLAQIDVAVVPSSWNEPLARVIGEAYAAGVPVIASRSGGIPEIVQDAVNGRLFDCGDAAAMSHLVAEFLDDPMQSRRLGENARRSLAADVRPVAALYLDAYEAVAQAPAANISSR